jgi:hypothetical protein
LPKYVSEDSAKLIDLNLMIQSFRPKNNNGIKGIV